MIAHCPNCKATVDAVELRFHFVGDGVAPYSRYTFGHCPRCQGPIVTVAEEDPFAGDGDQAAYGAEKQLYPVPEDRTVENLPRNIHAAYSEAQICYRAGAPTAAAIMCRKALEAICAEHDIKERTLADSLRAMRDKGLIESRLFEWADALRIIGNEAAHSIDLKVDAEDASDVLDFTTALMEYVFTFRDRFEKFQERRARNAAVKKGLRLTKGDAATA